MAIPAASVIELPPGMDARTAALTEPAATGAACAATRHARAAASAARAVGAGDRRRRGRASHRAPDARLRVQGAGRRGDQPAAPCIRRARRPRHVRPGQRCGPGRRQRRSRDRCGRRQSDPHRRPGRGEARRRGGAHRARRTGRARSTCASSRSPRSPSSARTRTPWPTCSATVAALAAGVFGPLDWVEERTLAEGASAFADLDQGATGAAKILLRPFAESPRH